MQKLKNKEGVFLTKNTQLDNQNEQVSAEQVKLDVKEEAEQPNNSLQVEWPDISEIFSEIIKNQNLLSNF